MKVSRLLAIVISTIIFFASGVAFAAPDAISDDVQTSEATSQEIKLSEKVQAEVERTMTILANPVYKARTQTIINRISPQMQRRLNYDVSIIDHKMVNAFALAGGKMYVTTGMLEFVKTDIELAGVIAHEMVHADKKHVLIQTSRNNRMTLLAIAAVIASKGKGAALMAANILHVAIMGAYSIDIEKEADALGIDALTRAGYNPIGSLTLQERLKEERMKHPEINPGIYQTHPEVDERIAAVEKYLKDHSISIERKYALGNLRTSITEETSGDCALAVTIDGEPVWRGASDAATRRLFERVASDLWKYLQLETVPFDVRVEGGESNPNSAFFVKAQKIVGRDELPSGTESLETLRAGVMRVLTQARNNHPMADYYK
jgi:Zn-dependent protease with chaperone function